MNIVMTGAGRFVEIQGTAEGMPFTKSEFEDLIDLAQKGILGLIAEEVKVLRKHLGEIDHLFEPEVLARFESPVGHD